MFDARELLGRLMQSDITKSFTDRLTHALSPQGVGGGNSPLGEALTNLTGGKGLSGLGGGAEELYGRTREAVKAGNPLAVGGVAAVLGAMLGSRSGGGGAVRGAVGGGLLAVLGSVAWKVMKERGILGADTAPEALSESPSPEEQKALENKALLIIRAMINAAKADGQIDEGERSRILGKLAEVGAGDEERAFVIAEMGKPMETEAIVGAVTDPATAVEVYSASLLAIEVDTPAERGYLQSLAQALQLDNETVGKIHQTLGVMA